MTIKTIDSSVMDAALDVLGAATAVCLCQGLPASYSAATTALTSSGNMLGTAAPGTLTKAAGDVSGRKGTGAQVTGISIGSTGLWDYVALVNSSGSKLLECLPMAYATMVSVNTGTKTFTVSGNITASCVPGQTISIRGSTGNDGIYTVVSATYSSPNTAVVVSQTVANSTGDGILIYGAQPVTSGNTATLNALKWDEIASIA